MCMVFLEHHTYCDFIEFNFANNEMESKRNFTFFETENHWPYCYQCHPNCYRDQLQCDNK